MPDAQSPVSLLLQSILCLEPDVSVAINLMSAPLFKTFLISHCPWDKKKNNPFRSLREPWVTWAHLASQIPRTSSSPRSLFLLLQEVWLSPASEPPHMPFRHCPLPVCTKCPSDIQPLPTCSLLFTTVACTVNHNSRRRAAA